MHSPYLPGLDYRAGGTPALPGEARSGLIIAPGKPRIEPVPDHEWPLWARVIAGFREPQDVGLGDTIVHLIGDSRSERFKKWFARKFGRSCGCADRQQWLNRRFAYPPGD